MTANRVIGITVKPIAKWVVWLSGQTTNHHNAQTYCQPYVPTDSRTIGKRIDQAVKSLLTCIASQTGIKSNIRLSVCENYNAVKQLIRQLTKQPIN
jgi:hypothetical protein